MHSNTRRLSGGQRKVVSGAHGEEKKRRAKRKQERWTEEQVDAGLKRHEGNSTMPSYLNPAQPWRMKEGGSIARPLWRSMVSRTPGGLASLDDGRGYVVTVTS